MTVELDVKRIGELIRDGRKKHKMTQQELAQKAKIGRTYLSQIESIKVLPSEEMVEKIATALKENPEDYIKAIQRERVVITDRSIRHKIEFIGLEHLLSRATRSFKYRGFSAVHFVADYFQDARQLIERGGTIQMILAKPTLKNLVKRANEDREDREIWNYQHFMLRVEQEHAKLMQVFAYLEEMWRYHQKRGVFELRLDPDYKPKERCTIVDDNFCLQRPSYGKPESGLSFSIYTENDPEFQKTNEEFTAALIRSTPMDWNDHWREDFGKYNANYITEEKVREANEESARETRIKTRQKRKASRRTPLKE